MATKPNVALARFADTGAADVAAPTSGLRDTGFVEGDQINQSNVNELFKQLYLWALYLSDGSLTGDHTIGGALEVAGALTCDAAAVLKGAITIGTGQPIAVASMTFTADSSPGASSFTKAAHGLETGDGPLLASNVGGALPAGLSPTVNYWAIKMSANVFRLATSLALAVAGTSLAITTNGTGTQSIAGTSATKRVFDATVTRNLVVGGGAVVSGGVSVGGSTALGGGLNVSGGTTLGGGLTVPAGQATNVGGAASLGGTVSVAGAATLSSSLSVTGGTTLSGGVSTGSITTTDGDVIKHPTREITLPASAFRPVFSASAIGQAALGAVNYLNVWHFGSGGVLLAPVPLRAGDRMTSVQFSFGFPGPGGSAAGGAVSLISEGLPTPQGSVGQSQLNFGSIIPGVSVFTLTVALKILSNQVYYLAAIVNDPANTMCLIGARILYDRIE